MVRVNSHSRAPVDEMIARAREFAAVRGAFKPVEAVQAATPDGVERSPVMTNAVLAALRQDCRTDVAQPDHWIMRYAPRHALLARLKDRDALAELDFLGEDAAVSTLLAALGGDGDYSTVAIENLLKSPDADPLRLRDMVEVLGRAGPAAPAFSLAERLHSTLNQAKAEARSEDQLRDGFFGRKRELKAIAEWIGAAGVQPPAKALFISGIAGIGKSFLLEKALVEARLSLSPIVLRLDFDRRGLTGSDPTLLLGELSRQIGDGFPEMADELHRIRVRHTAAADRMGLLETDSMSAPVELLEAMARAVRRAERPVLLVLDTLEVLRAHGESHPVQLFETLDSMLRAGVAPMAVIAAGRGDALDTVPDRVVKPRELEGLEAAPASEMLTDLGVGEALHDRIIAGTRGNPLLLRLAAKAIQSGTFDPDELDPTKEPTVIGAYLYRAILSRIENETLRKIAHPGLVLQRISAESLTEVVGPALGVRIAPEDADELFEELCSHHWLVVYDKPGWVSHRTDMRQAILPLMYEERGEQAQAINREAAEWFRDFDETAALYHALQATRGGDPMPEISPNLASEFGPDWLDELPVKAADAVRQARGERSSVGRAKGSPGKRRGTSRKAARAAGRDQGTGDRKALATAPSLASPQLPPVEERILRDLEMTLREGDVREAGYVYEAGVEGHDLQSGEARVLAMAYDWFAGNWTKADKAFRALSLEEKRDRLASDPELIGIVLTEIEAHFRFDGLVRSLKHDGGFARLVVRAREAGEKLALKGGALDLALLVASGRHASYAFDRFRVAQAIVSLGRGDPDPAIQVVESEASYVAERFGVRVETGSRPVEHELTRLNPYTQVLARVAESRQSPMLTTHLGRLFEHFRQVQELLGIDEGFEKALHLHEGEIEAGVEVLGAAGLSGGWSGAYAFFHRIPNFNRVARAAVRWERALAGVWAYGRSRPDGWRDRADERTRKLTKHLWQFPVTGAAAEDLLELLGGLDGVYPDAIERRIWQRLQRVLADARSLHEFDEGPLSWLYEIAGRVASANVPWTVAAAIAAIEESRPGAIAHQAAAAAPPIAAAATTALEQQEGLGTTKLPNVRMTAGGTSMTSLSERAFQESASRLESLRGGGRFDAAAKLIEANANVMRTLGIDMDVTNVEAALNAADAPQLEAAGMPPMHLEAIIRVTSRPPMIVRGNTVQQVPLTDEKFGPDTGDKIVRAQKYLGSVGRMEFVNHSMRWGGTAWVLHEEDDETLLVVTNRHVAEIVARRTSRGEGVFMRSPVSMIRYGAVLDFNEEVGASVAEAREAQIEKFTYLADDVSADVAIGRIKKPQGFVVSPLPLSDTAGEDEEMVAVVGYPAYDSRNDQTAMERYFQGIYDVKRFAPGFLNVQSDVTVIGHDCTTLGGNSGSPVISLDNDNVVGLHFAGQYGVENSAVSAATLHRLLKGERPLSVQVEMPGEERPDGDHSPDFFDGRAGYDPDFLDGQTVPLPQLPEGDFTLSQPSDRTQQRPHELRYTHFGVLYCEARKSPVVTAVNIDGEKAIKIKRGRDQWFFDLRIPREAQLGQHDFPGDLDRGHMVRREDPNWGDSHAIAERANFDTFHYTNASPQHVKLNRNRSTWQGLENHILDSTKTHGFRASVFTGPVFDEEDPYFDEIGVTLPMEYWKVVVMLAETDNGPQQLHAAAYLLSQGRLIEKYLRRRARRELVEGFVFGEYKTYQIAISALEEQTGYDFGPLRNADPLQSRAEALELPAGTPLFLELEDTEQIVL